MLLPKDHPQKVANREDNERQRKRKKDEAKKKQKHADHEARHDTGEDTDTIEEDDGEDIEDFGNISLVSFNLKGKVLRFLFVCTILADDPYDLYFGGGSTSSQPDVSAVGASQGLEPPTPRRLTPETSASHDPSGGVETARVEPSGGVATPLAAAGVSDAPPPGGQCAPSPPGGPVATFVTQTAPAGSFGPML